MASPRSAKLENPASQWFIEKLEKQWKSLLLNDSLRSWKNHENRCIERLGSRKSSFSMIHWEAGKPLKMGSLRKNAFQATSWSLLEPKLEELGAKMAVKSANIGQHDCQDGHFGFNLAASGSIWGAFWSHLGKQAEYRKTLKNLGFLLVFQGFGRSWRPGLEQLGAMLSYVEPSWRHFGLSWKYVRACWRQDAPR